MKIVLAIFLTLITLPTYAQDKLSAIDKIFSWASPSTPGCSCTISQNGKVVASRTFGSADLERATPISSTTVFDIGSTRKQFVAAAILILIEDKKLSLTDDVSKYFPELPNYGHKITIDHMLTHTSGLRDWTGLQPLATGDPDALTLIFRQRELNFVPGEEWSYSNSGYVLLTELVKRISGMSFSEFTQKRMFEPLGMKSTSYVNDLTGTIKNRSLAYKKENNNWKLAMLLGNDRGGAGALFSTADDLAIWNDALTNNKLGAFVSEKLQEPTKLASGRKLNYARGLIVDPHPSGKLIWHSGGAAGYHSWLGRLPAQNLSVAILCNSDAVAATALGNRIMALFASSTNAVKPEDGPPPTLTGDALADINKKAGLFFEEKTGEAIRLAVDGNRFRIAGGPGLVPVSENRFRRWGATVFFMSQDEFEINFFSNDQFELKSMEGKKTIYKRAKPSEATADLKVFEGKYQSDEIGAFFDVVGSNGVLNVRANDGAEGIEFSSVNPDTYQRGNIRIHFLRNKTGKITGLEFTNPVVRKVKFARK